MTKRERAERAMACQETDRVPLFDILRNDAAFAHFGGQPLPPLASDPDTEDALNRIVGKAVDAFLDMTRSVHFGPLADADIKDEEFGFMWRASAYEKTSWIIHRPFADEEGAARYVKAWTLKKRAEVEAIKSNPAAHRELFRKKFAKRHAYVKDTVVLLTEHGIGLDEVRRALGFELFAYLQADDPGLLSEAFETVTERNVAECHAIADLALSPAVLTYGDIACKQRLLHSPQYLRAEFFPRIKRINDAWHEHGFKVLFHSDGLLTDVMDDLLASGIDGLNPIETLAGMTLKDVRRKCGNRLFLTSGIDMSQLLSNGTPDEVREVCRQSIRDAAPGYFMGSTTEADNSCRLENLIAMYEVAHGA